MSEATEITARVVAALEKAAVPHMLVGAFSRNYYAFPRSTQDADLVVSLDAGRLSELMTALGADFELDPQPSFETNTGTLRETVQHRASGFKIELFRLSSDPHDQARFQRRGAVSFEGLPTFIPTAEDVILTKLRWARSKDLDDVRDVIAVQGDAALDWDYIHRWTEIHGTRARLDAIRASIPPID